MIPRLISLLAVFLCLLPSVVVAQSKREPLPPAPPQPVALAAKVRREGKTEIPLRIYGVAHEPLKYLIRIPPEHGKLSEPVQKDRESATIVYEPPADLSITTDKFSYAVQSSAGVSAAVEISLTIVDQPPQLGIADSLEFAEVQAGQTSVKMLELTNQGGLIARGEVIVDAPWKIDGKAGYKLGAGDVAIFRIIFAPTAGGDFDGVARYTSDPEHSTRLRGKAIAPLALEPAELVLQVTPGDTTRTGTLTVINNTDEARTLRAKANSRLVVPAEVQVPAKGKATVPVQTRVDDIQSLLTDLQFTAGDLVLTVPVKAAGLGPMFRIAQQSISFGRLSAGKSATASFELENIGSSPGEISWQIGAPFSTEQKSVILSPGEKKSYALKIDPKAAGSFRAWLHFQAPTQSFDLPVGAEVAEGPSRAGAPNTATAEAEPEHRPAAPESEEKLPQTRLMPPEWVADVPAPPAVKTTLPKPTTAIIEWPVKLSTATNFRLEMRQLITDADGKLGVTWVAPTGIPIVRKGDVYTATLEELDPGQAWTVRVLPLSASGEAGPRLFAIDFRTPLKVPVTSKIPWFPGAVVVLVILLGWQGWERWQRFQL